jgi:hypothetical protein
MSMRTSTLFRGAALSVLVFATLWAADVSGKWIAEFTTPDGQTRQSTFNFEVSGETLTGTVGSSRGESKIEDGKVVGDDISFNVTRNFGGNDMKFAYKGKVAGDEIKLTVTVGEGDRTFEMVAKRAQ